MGPCVGNKRLCCRPNAVSPLVGGGMGMGAMGLMGMMGGMGLGMPGTMCGSSLMPLLAAMGMGGMGGMGMGMGGCMGGSLCQGLGGMGGLQALMFQQQLQQMMRMMMMRQMFQSMMMPRLGMSLRVCTCPPGMFSMGGMCQPFGGGMIPLGGSCGMGGMGMLGMMGMGMGGMGSCIPNALCQMGVCSCQPGFFPTGQYCSPFSQILGGLTGNFGGGNIIAQPPSKKSTIN